MSVTLTLVSTRPKNPIEPKVLHLHALPPQAQVLTREIIAEALDNLSFIASEYVRFDDPLSRQLHVWCMEVIEQFDDTQEVSRDYMEEVAARIHELTHEILINPIDKAPLLNPILVNDELPVWERRMWVDFQNAIHVPAQDGRIHEFAVAMLEWRNTLPIAELNPMIEFNHAVFQPLQQFVGSSTRPYLNEAFYQRPDEIRADTYVIEKGIALARIGSKNLQQSMQVAASTCRALWEDAKRHIARITGEIAERERQHTEMLRQSILSMETSYRNEANILKQHIDSLRSQLVETSVQLGNCQSELVVQAGQLRALRTTMANLAAQNEANRHKANRRRCIIS